MSSIGVGQLDGSLLLGQPITIGNLDLRNRIIAAPMERNYCAQDGQMTEQYRAYLEARAEGGAALVFTEASYVRSDGKGRRHQMGIHEDHVIDGIAAVAERVHRHGAFLGIELNHCGNVSQSHVTGYPPVAPSAVPCEVAGGDIPRELDSSGIRHLVEDFASAAVRAIGAGVDVLSLHAAHGYLIHQFMMPRTNQRSDEYRDPVRFLNEVLVAVRDAAGATPVGIRISAFEGTEQGLDAATTLRIVAGARLDLVDLIDVSAGCYEAGQWIVQSGEWREGILAEAAAKYRQFGRPVSVAGRIATPESAEAILRSGQADLVSLARALHAGPTWPLWALGEAPAPRPCIACALCSDELALHGPIRCSVNPEAGREHEARPASSGERRDQVVIVGAGPAGLELACALARGGRRVRLVEREPWFGGQLALAARTRQYPQYRRVIDWYGEQLAVLSIDVELDRVVDPAWIKKTQPETLVLAIGSAGHLPQVEGIANRRVVDARDWLRRGSSEGGHGAHVVWGADREGVAIADDLAGRGAHVLLIHPGESIAEEVGRRAKILVVPRLLSHPRVDIRLRTDVRCIEDQRVLVTTDRGEAWIEAPGPLIVSLGASADVDAKEWLRGAAGDARVFEIGDVVGRRGSLADAITDGYRLAHRLISV